MKRRHQGQAGPYSPFANAHLFVRAVWLYAVYAMPWGKLGSLVYLVRRGDGVRRRIAVLNQRDGSLGSSDAGIVTGGAKTSFTDYVVAVRRK